VTYRSIFLAAFIQVSLVAGQTVLLSRGNWIGIGIVGFLISWVWFGNARNAARSELPRARVVYATGAMVGTLTGALTAHWLG
jgi:hypothetical protein